MPQISRHSVKLLWFRDEISWLKVLGKLRVLKYQNPRGHFIYSLISTTTMEKKLKDLVELMIRSPFVDIFWIRAM
ncbi:hypothetical protein AHAS_Ahas16G0194500 [Arachis hypogaea]